MIKKENNIFTTFFIVILMVLLLALLGGKFFPKGITFFKSNSTQSTNTTSVDWEKLFPYDTTINTDGISTNTTNQTSTIDNTVSLLSKFSTIGNTFSKKMYKYNEMSKLGFMIHSTLSDASIGNTYVKLKNGYWDNPDSIKVDSSKARSILSNYSYLQNYLESKDIGFLYFSTPRKECVVDNELLEGVTVYDNENIDTYTEAMEELGINNVDLRKKLHEDNLDHYSLFYKTDHHWNIDGGIWAASTIEKELNSRFNLNMQNVYDFGTYTRKTYKNAMFGSIGAAITHFNADSEDYDILYPDFTTNFTLEIPEQGISTTGSFEDIFVDTSRLEYCINKGGSYAYESLLHGTPGYERIVNNNNPDGPKILMIRDSMAIAVAPYLACSCSELILIDTRSGNGNFTGSIINCINQFNPDVVVSLQISPQELKLNK